MNSVNWSPFPHTYELSDGFALDDWELGIRVAVHLWQENNAQGVAKYEWIAKRGYEAQGIRRLRHGSRRNSA